MSAPTPPAQPADPPPGEDIVDAVAPARPSQSFGAQVWRGLKKDPAGLVGMGGIALLLVVALLAPLLANDRPIVCKYDGDIKFPAVATYVDTWVPWRDLQFAIKGIRIGDALPFSDFDPDLGDRTWKAVADSAEMEWALWPPIPWSPRQFDKENLKQPPGEAHVLGTDDQGRDVLARLIHGSVVAVLVGVVSMGIACLIGITLGLLAGYYGGKVDLVLSRVTEIVICFPVLFLIITVIAFLPPSVLNIMIVIGLRRWTGIFRLIRGEVFVVRQQEYVTAAEALGVPPRSILFRHILPNAVAPVFVTVAFGIAGAVLVETSLSFLGFGDPYAPSWGEVVMQGRRYVSQGLWHLTVFPGLCIFATLTAFNLFGQSLRDAMDPKLRR